MTWLLGALFVGAGALHFVFPRKYMQAMPPYLPWPLALIYVSGACEIAGGMGVCVRPLRRYAGWGLVALLIAVFPANVYMATNHVMLAPWVAWARLPLQGLLIWWVVRGTAER